MFFNEMTKEKIILIYVILEALLIGLLTVEYINMNITFRVFSIIIVGLMLVSTAFLTVIIKKYT